MIHRLNISKECKDWMIESSYIFTFQTKAYNVPQKLHNIIYKRKRGIYFGKISFELALYNHTIDQASFRCFEIDRKTTSETE